jgi:hypothetical protein
MDELMRIISMQSLVTQLDEAANTARHMRDAAVYDYVSDATVNRRELCRQMGISSARLYGILTAEEARRSEDEGFVLELAHIESMQLWDEAVYEWREAGEAGTPDDYFDLNRLRVERRA